MSSSRGERRNVVFTDVEIAQAPFGRVSGRLRRACDRGNPDTQRLAQGFSAGPRLQKIRFAFSFGKRKKPDVLRWSQDGFAKLDDASFDSQVLDVDAHLQRASERKQGTVSRMGDVKHDRSGILCVVDERLSERVSAETKRRWRTIQITPEDHSKQRSRYFKSLPILGE